jgi:hypothetical protein
MAKRGCLQTTGLIIGGLVVFGILGAALDRTDTAVREATSTPKIIVPTHTAVVIATSIPVTCDTSAWIANTVEAYDMWGNAKSVVEIDGIISKYDSLAMPDCDASLLALDEHIRMGLATQRTALMLDEQEAKKYIGQALLSYMQAGEILKDLANE